MKHGFPCYRSNFQFDRNFHISFILSCVLRRESIGQGNNLNEDGCSCCATPCTDGSLGSSLLAFFFLKDFQIHFAWVFSFFNLIGFQIHFIADNYKSACDIILEPQDKKLHTKALYQHPVSTKKGSGELILNNFVPLGINWSKV